MPYLELSLHCRESEQPRYENALEDVGALAVTLLDADAETPNERAILEPGVGEMPIWGEVALSALFAEDADPLLLLAALEAFDPDLDGVDPVGPAVRYQHLELDLLAARGVEELVAVTVLVARLFQQGLGPFQVELVLLAVLLLDVRVVPGGECLAKP